MFFFVGAITLWLEAHRLFHDQKLKMVLSKGRFPRLSGISYDQLSTARTYNRGYFFYVATYLIIYAVSVFSIEVGELWIKSSNSIQQSGGQGALPTSTQTEALVSGEASPWPLAVALAMISLLSARNQAGKTLRSFEMMFRNFAHRLAGIPNSIYRLVTRLGRVNYTEAIKGSDAPYLDMFDNTLERMTADVNDHSVTRQRLDIARNDFKAIDSLEPAVCGAFQDSVFPIENTETMMRLLKDQAKECEALQKMLQKALDDAQPVPTLDEMRAIAEAGRDCLRNLKALFAVLYSQTDSDDIGSIYPPVNRVLQELTAPDRFFLKDKVVISVLLTTFALFIFYPAWRLYGFIMEGREQGRTVADVMSADLIFVVERAAQDILPMAILFLLVSVVTLSIRRNLIDTEDWEDYDLVNVPITRLLKTIAFPSIFAAAGGAATIFLLQFLLLVLDGSFSFTILIEKVLVPLLPVFALYIPLAVIIGLPTLVVADQHLKMQCWKTVLCASVFALPFAFAALLGQFLMTSGRPSPGDPNFENLNALYQGLLGSNIMAGAFQSLFALAFLALFAFLVEQAENEEERHGAGGLATDPDARGADQSLGLGSTL
ncbi:hypothetical protein [Roseovarius albus]|nr:hypothetical protein [Roseovarius albus]